MDDDRAKHLEFIQGIISRMAGNSFLLKGWSVTLVAAIFAVAVQTHSRVLMLGALIPALSFWGLDAWYLRQERLFRRLYEDVSTPDSLGGSSVPPWSLSTADCCARVESWFRTLWSGPVLGLHGPVLAAVVAAAIVAVDP